MDFTLDEEQADLSELALRILTDKLTPDQLKLVESGADWFAADVWAELAKADLLGLCLPEADGGGGYGIFEACLLLTAIGRTVAPLPLLASVVLGAMPLAEFGSAAQRAQLLPGVIDGSIVLTAALVEEGDSLPPAVPATTVAVGRRATAGDCSTATKWFVPAAHLATRILVPARTADGRSTVFLVDPAAAGVTIESQVLTNLEPLGVVRFDAVSVSADDVVGEVDGGGRDRAPGSPIGRWPGSARSRPGCASRPCGWRPSTRPSATSSTPRSRPSRPSPSAWPTPTSTPRRCG